MLISFVMHNDREKQDPQKNLVAISTYAQFKIKWK